MVTLENLAPRQALRAVQAELAAAGCPDAGYDARELCRMALGADPRLAPDAPPLNAAQAGTLAALARRRAAREPLQYIAGTWDFLDFTLRVGPGVLCPRADSEVVCETAAALLAGKQNPRVLDLCAGTGCLGLGIKRFVPEAAVRCVEKSEAAWPYLVQNAAHTLENLTVEPVRADVLDFWRSLGQNSVDLILSNPPYLSAREMAGLMPETAREPAMALDGGADGLDFYRCLLRDYRAALAPGGAIVLEIGYAQREAVLALAGANQWQGAACRRDYGGNDRVIVVQKSY